MITWIFILILAQLTLVSWIDIRTKKIANYWVAINLVLGILFSFLYPNDYPLGWSTFIFPVGWIVFGFCLFVLGIMGAGDSKYLASLFLIIPSKYQVPMFEKIIYCTLIVGIIMLLIKIAKDFQKIKAYAFSTYWQGLKENIRSNFSYAPVIFLAWILLGIDKWK